MKGLLFREPGKVVLSDLADPTPGEGEVLVAVKAAGICGSDLHGVSDGMYPYPAVLGHEFAGVTEDGRRVAVNPQVPCRGCGSCLAGASNLCTANNIIGITRSGAVAETVVVPADRIVELPDGASWTAGAMAEVVANGIHALARGGGAAGKRIGVIGAGPIGLATLMCARHDGAETVSITDLSEARLAVAARLGADTVDTTLDEEAFDLVVDAVGTPGTRTASLAALRRGGTAVWIGVNAPEASLNASMDIVVGERTVAGSFAYTDEEFVAAVQLAARHSFDWVDTYSLDESERVFEKLAAGQSGSIKAHFTMEAQL